jgi:threonine aldolase
VLGLPRAAAFWLLKAWRAGLVDALSFGFVKNGGMNAEAIVFFDMARRCRPVSFQRAPQPRVSFLAAQILAMVEGELWLTKTPAQPMQRCSGNRRGRGDRLVSVEANERSSAAPPPNARLCANRASALRLAAMQPGFVAAWNTWSRRRTVAGSGSCFMSETSID